MTSLSLWLRLTLLWEPLTPSIELSPMTVAHYEDSGALEAVELTPCLVSYDGDEIYFETRLETSLRYGAQ